MRKCNYLSRPEIYLMLKVQQHYFPAEMTARLYSDLADVPMAAISNTAICTFHNNPFRFFIFFFLLWLSSCSDPKIMECERELWQRIIVFVYCWINGLFSTRLMQTPALSDIESCRCMHQWAGPLLVNTNLNMASLALQMLSSIDLPLASISLDFYFCIFPKQILACWLYGNWFHFRCNVLEWRMRWNEDICANNIHISNQICRLVFAYLLKQVTQ